MHKTVIKPAEVLTDNIHETRHTVTLHAVHVRLACEEYAARRAGVDLKSEYVSVSTDITTTENDGAVEVTVVLVDRHLNKPRAA